MFDVTTDLTELLTQYRDGIRGYSAGITEVFLAALGTDGTAGFQCELGFGNGTTCSFQGPTLGSAVSQAKDWVHGFYNDMIPERP